MEEPVTVDGRSARRERGRAAVIDAVVDLLQEGHAPPTTPQVVERAGISEASLFRYFRSIDDLQLEATARFLDRHAHLFEIPASGQGALEVRIDRFASSRTALWDAIGPMARLGRARSFEHPALADLLLGARLAQADQVRQQFAPELEALAPQARADAVAVIVSLTAFEAWDLQRQDLGRTPAQVRRAWRTALRALLTPPTPPTDRPPPG
ncbi:MAG TPA: TetR/AcrR family transcriptional regulator, partial [Acidimicrobiales bacterium]|nr:TetR/AcrR family transcriptional regulator [Acidimicrobiales bacterium]